MKLSFIVSNAEWKDDVVDELRLVLVFDEVSGLGPDSLRYLCSALSEFTDVFAVFIDTVSSISLLAPQQSSHPSTRVSIHGLQLFHPFSALSCYNSPFDHLTYDGVLSFIS